MAQSASKLFEFQSISLNTIFELIHLSESVNSHFEEWSRLVEKVPDDQVASSVAHLIDINYSIHFHVWTQMEFLELLLYCKQHYFNFEIELLQKNGVEFITILRKIVFQDIKS